MGHFQAAIAKLTIASVDVEKSGGKLEVKAQYNPSELQITQPFGWSEAQSTAGQATEDVLMEFGGMKPGSMQIELLFDGAENEGFTGNEKAQGPSIMELIETLKVLATVRDPHGPTEELRRPHYCIVVWGNGGMRPFRCVIESLTTKFLRWTTTGRVLRASVTVTLKSADRVQIAKNQRKPGRRAA